MIVFLPGTLGTVEVFYKQLLAFSDRYRVVALGYPGNSDAATMTASFRAVLAELDIGAAHFAGSSLGGYWLQVVLHEEVSRIRSLLLGNTFLDPARLRFIQMFDPAFLASTDPAAVKQDWLHFVHALPQPELKAFMLEAVGARQSDAELDGRSRTISVAPRAMPLNLPPDRVTLLWCEDDKVISADTWRELCDAYPGARQARFPYGGHYPHLLAPNEYNQEIAFRLARGISGAASQR